MASKLADLCSFAKGKVATAALNSTTYISTENMLPNKEGIVTASSLPTIEQTQEYLPGDVLVSNIRPYFRKIWMATGAGGCSNDVLVFRAKPSCDPSFLYYLLSDNRFFDYATATSKGTKMPRGDKAAIMEYAVPNFDIETQRRIAATLSGIGEKITINRKINDNLEQQAMALVESILASGEPTVLGQLMSFENGFTFQSNTYQSAGTYRVITIKNVQDGRIDSTGAAYLSDIPTKMKPSCLLKPGDALLSLTGNVGRVGIVCEENLLLNQRVAKISAMNPAWLPFLYFMFRLPSTKTTLESIAKGTAQQNLSPVETLKLEIPFDKVLVDTHSGLLSRIYATMLNTSQENLRLAALRDALLPKLMSGEIDVSDTEI